MKVLDYRIDPPYKEEWAKVQSFVLFNSFVIWGIPLAMGICFLPMEKEPTEGFFDALLCYGGGILLLLAFGIYMPCASFTRYIIPSLIEKNIKELSKANLRYVWGGFFGAILLLICSAMLAQFSKPFSGCVWAYYPFVLLYAAIFLTRRWYGALVLAAFLSLIPVVGAVLFALLALSFSVLLLERHTTVFSRLGVKLKCKNFPIQ